MSFLCKINSGTLLGIPIRVMTVFPILGFQIRKLIINHKEIGIVVAQSQPCALRYECGLLHLIYELYKVTDKQKQDNLTNSHPRGINTIPNLHNGYHHEFPQMNKSSSLTRNEIKSPRRDGCQITQNRTTITLNTSKSIHNKHNNSTQLTLVRKVM